MMIKESFILYFCAGTDDGVATIRQCPQLLKILTSLVLDKAEVIATDACLALINLSADAPTVPVLLKINIVNNLYKVSFSLLLR